MSRHHRQRADAAALDGTEAESAQTNDPTLRTPEESQPSSSLLDLDSIGLGLGLNDSQNSDFSGLFPIDSFDHWSSPVENNPSTTETQFPNLESMHIDPALAFDYSGLDTETAPHQTLSNAILASHHTNPWGQSRSPSPLSRNQFQSTPPFEADFQSQMRQFSMMDYRQGTLPRRRSRYLRSPTESTAPIPIPNSATDSTSDPMQRWQDSPPETEAASLSAIAGALKNALPRPASSESLRSRGGLSRAASTASFNSERTSHSSKSATSARSSISRDLLSRPNTRAGVSKGKRTTPKPKPKERRTFQCTFCCDSFKSKYDWSRHEKSLHLSLDGWVCTPHGGAVVSPDTGRSHCTYCNMLDPTPEHLETHNYSICQSSGSPHIFNRKDHLVQHLRLAHQLETLPLIDDWKVEAPPVRSRCGICDTMMSTWQERMDHISQHFRKGKSMEDWKGDHCFDPSIAALVANALPPYLIAAESKSLVPFSATDSGTKDHYIQIQDNHLQNNTVGDEAPAPMPPSPDQDPTTTFINILTLGLAQFARQQMRLGVMPTDDMFQKESRRLVYGSEDAWDWTIADNNEWLSSFRSQNMEENQKDKSQ